MEKRLENQDFVNSINGYDIIILNETWTHKNSTLELDGFVCPFVKHRPKRRNAKRYSGGVVCFIKNHIKEGISEEQWNFDDGIIIKLDKVFFGLEENISLICPYLSPSSSTRNAANVGIDVFDILFDKISEVSNNGQVCLIGDLNSRIADFNYPSMLDDDDDDDQELEHDYLITEKSIFQSDLIKNGLSLQRVSKDRVTNEYGRSLINLMKSTQMICLNGIAHNDKNIGKPTWTEKRGNKLLQSVVDYVICSKEMLYFVENFTVHDINIHSDHAILSFDLNCNAVTQSNVSEIPNNVPFTKPLWKDDLYEQYQKNINQDEVLRLLHTISSDLVKYKNNASSTDDDTHSQSPCAARAASSVINSCVDKLVRVFEIAGSGHSISIYPKNNDSINHDLNKNNSWYDKDCIKMRDEFLKASKAHKITNNDSDKSQMCKIRNKYRKLCKYKRYNHKKKDANELIDLFKHNSRQFWRKMKKRKKNKIGNCDFFEYFKRLNNIESSIDPDILDDIQDSEQNLQGVSVEMLDEKMTIDELETGIKMLKKNKACGVDGILNEFLIFSSPLVKETILEIFNTILDTGQFPELWATGEIVPVFKKGDVNNPSDYRGLCLISCVAKLFTCLINNRLNCWAELNEKFCKNQYGFRKNKSVTDCIFIVHGLIEHFLSKSVPFYCSFVDLKKAFDYTNRPCLWHKLKINGVSSKLVELIKNLYSKIKLRVRSMENEFHNDKQQEPDNREDDIPFDEEEPFSRAENLDNENNFFTSICGVFQGESLSPFLFSMYLNDLDHFLRQSDDVGVQIEHFILTVLLFADDMVLFSKTREGLQNALNSLQKYCTLWGLTVNTEKTKCVAFKKGGRIGQNDRWYFDGVLLETVTTFKYLGFILSSSGKFAKSIAAIIDQGRIALFNMNSFLHKYPHLDIKTKLKVFNCLVIPVIEYACEIWGFCAADKLDTFYLGFLKSILGVRKTTPSVFIYRELNIYPLKLKRYMRIFKYWLKIIALPDHEPVKSVYNVLKNDVTTSPDTVNWVSLLKKLLNESGLGYLWESQLLLPESKSYYTGLFKDRIQDILLQDFNTDLEKISNNRLYKHIDHDFYGKDYLTAIKHNHLRIALSKLRLGSHNFMVERGRWARPPLDHPNRICKECDELEDEMHIFFECVRYRVLRKQYLPAYLLNKPSMAKFIDFLHKTSGDDLLKLAIFVFKVFKHYDSNEI